MEIATAKHLPQLCTRTAHVRFSSTARPWQLVRDMRRAFYVTELEAAFPDKAVAPHVLQDFVRRAKEIDVYKDPEAFQCLRKRHIFHVFECLKVFFRSFFDVSFSQL